MSSAPTPRISPRNAKILGAVAVVLVLVGVAWWRFERFYVRWLVESPSAGRCERHLTRPILDRSIKLGTGFLLAHQKPQGNFDYEYDWRAQKLSEDDQETRQAGALWGLTLLYQDDQRPELAAAIERGLGFFEAHSRAVKGKRCFAYPGSSAGTMGAIALVALAQTEYLRASPSLPSARRAELEARVGEYLSMLVQSVHPNGLWHQSFDAQTCAASGEPSSYYDGEALLALVKAAKYLDRKDLLPTIMAAAAAGRGQNIDQAREANADSDVTKGYYQWSTMAFYELATSDFPNTRIYGDTVLDLADWVVDEHNILTRNRNTGYAFEGITEAYALAKQRGDSARQAKYACVIDIALERLISWQVGSPLPNRYTAQASPTDTKALGGVQNEAFDAALRIDVTQHQMHALQLARQYVY